MTIVILVLTQVLLKYVLHTSGLVWFGMLTSLHLDADAICRYYCQHGGKKQKKQQQQKPCSLYYASYFKGGMKHSLFTEFNIILDRNYSATPRNAVWTMCRYSSLSQ